jgi:hypothetical protein
MKETQRSTPKAASDQVELKQTPTLIRAHHLEPVQFLVRGGTPEATAEDIIATINTKRATTPESTREHPDSEVEYKHTDTNYAYDVLGHTQQEEDTVRTRLQSFFEAFNELPDDAPVTLVDGQKDDLCKSCIHGKHCDAVKGIGDTLYLEAFAAVAMKQEAQTDTVHDMEYTLFPNPSNPTEKSILNTTAGVVRAVLEDGDALEIKKEEIKKRKQLEKNLTIAQYIQQAAQSRQENF